MNTKVDFEANMEKSIVYVRPVLTSDLPEEIREKMGAAKQVYSVHSAEGAPIALVKDRHMAFVLARQHDMAPVHVH